MMQKFYYEACTAEIHLRVIMGEGIATVQKITASILIRVH
jgi:hypothetical protein